MRGWQWPSDSMQEQLVSVAMHKLIEKTQAQIERPECSTQYVSRRKQLKTQKVKKSKIFKFPTFQIHVSTFRLFDFLALLKSPTQNVKK